MLNKILWHVNSHEKEKLRYEDYFHINVSKDIHWEENPTITVSIAEPQIRIGKNNVHILIKDAKVKELPHSIIYTSHAIENRKVNIKPLALKEAFAKDPEALRMLIKASERKILKLKKEPQKKIKLKIRHFLPKAMSYEHVEIFLELAVIHKGRIKGHTHYRNAGVKKPDETVIAHVHKKGFKTIKTLEITSKRECSEFSKSSLTRTLWQNGQVRQEKVPRNKIETCPHKATVFSSGGFLIKHTNGIDITNKYQSQTLQELIFEHGSGNVAIVINNQGFVNTHPTITLSVYKKIGSGIVPAQKRMRLLNIHAKNEIQCIKELKKLSKLILESNKGKLHIYANVTAIVGSDTTAGKSATRNLEILKEISDATGIPLAISSSLSMGNPQHAAIVALELAYHQVEKEHLEEGLISNYKYLRPRREPIKKGKDVIDLQQEKEKRKVFVIENITKTCEEKGLDPEEVVQEAVILMEKEPFYTKAAKAIVIALAPPLKKVLKKIKDWRRLQGRTKAENDPDKNPKIRKDKKKEPLNPIASALSFLRSIVKKE